MAAAKQPKSTPEGEWLSISEISRRCKLDRRTCTARLEDLGYEPDPEHSRANSHVYFFDDAMEFAVKSAKDSMAAAKIRDLRATYELKELKLAEARGELVPMGDAVEIAQKLTSAMYKEFAIQQPKRLATRLAKCKTAAQATKLMKADTEKFMARLRGNFQEVLG